MSSSRSALVFFAGLLASALAVTGAGCASLLGGLDEGTVAADAEADAPAANDAAARDARCDGWLAGFRYRTPLVVKHQGSAISAYQVKATLPAAAPIAAGKMRADAGDLRVTLSDGVTVAPHWIQDGIGTSALTLWTRVDLADGVNDAWVYYGSPAAPNVSSATATFAPAIIDDPTFDRSDAWYPAHEDSSNRPASRTNEWSVTLGDGKATIRMFRAAVTNGALAGICQTMLFPAGSSYRFVFDVNVTLADHASTRVAYGGLSGTTAWRTLTNEIGFLPGSESSDIAPGSRSVCMAVNLEGDSVGQGGVATFSGLRVRRVAKPEPVVELPGTEAEAAGCP